MEREFIYIYVCMYVYVCVCVSIRVWAAHPSHVLLQQQHVVSATKIVRQAALLRGEQLAWCRRVLMGLISIATHIYGHRTERNAYYNGDFLSFYNFTFAISAFCTFKCISSNAPLPPFSACASQCRSCQSNPHSEPARTNFVSVSRTERHIA